MMDDRFSHSFPFKRVFRCFIQSSLSQTDSSSSNWRTSVVKGSHGVQESFADFSNNVRFWHTDVFKSNTASVRTSLSHIDFLATWSDALPFSFNNETSKCL